MLDDSVATPIDTLIEEINLLIKETKHQRQIAEQYIDQAEHQLDKIDEININMRKLKNESVKTKNDSVKLKKFGSYNASKK